MSGQRFVYDSERQRHERFVGRAELIAKLDRLLVDSSADRWVVVTGGPGMGKSAILSTWLAWQEAAGAAVPHHFIRRGQYNWDDPSQLVSSLVAQLEELFELCEPEADERLHPAARLHRMLSRVAPRGERLVVVIDGLDEYDPPPGAAGDPLAAFLPHALPAGVSVLCASRPRHPHLASLAARDGELVQIDLDDPTSATDNEATVHAFWDREAGPLGFDPQVRDDARFLDEVVARADGNLQHAVQLRKQLAALPAEQRRAARHRIEDIPRGLAALIALSWERVAVDPIVVAGLGILCAAREALSLDELAAVAGWSGDPPRRAFLRGARELLVETSRPDGTGEFRLHHDSIRAHVAKELGSVALSQHHRSLAERLAAWPCPAAATSRRYALRHALIHRADAGDWAAAWRVAGDLRFLEAKCRELGVDETEADVARLAERFRASGDDVLGQRAGELARALARESHRLRAAPEATTALVWNRLRRFGWSANELDGQLQVPEGASFLQVRHAHTRESPALVRDFEGHSDWVNACAVAPDGRHVVSASSDKALKVWELASGRALATLEGHSGWVTACAVTLDGRHVVSASADQRLKIWELASGRARATLVGHTGEVTACAVTPDGRHVVSASADQTLKVWELTTRRALATFAGHTDKVTACAVTPDGRYVVSASWDYTLKVWECATGRALATLTGHTDKVTACAVTPDGRHVVSASWDHTLKVWELATGCALATFAGHTDKVTACTVTPGGRHVVSASWDKTLRVWELVSGRALATLEGHTYEVTACAVTPDGGHVVSASDDQTLKVWELVTGCAVATHAGHTYEVTACALTPDGRHAVSASRDRTLKVWECASGRVLATHEGYTSVVNACAVTPDGEHVVSASVDQTLKVWELATGRTLRTLKGHAGVVTACAVTPDGRHVVSASGDKTLKVWELATGRTLATLAGHTDWVTECGVTPDGRHVVSASKDWTLKVWELATGRAVATLVGHTHWVLGCAVTPDGRHVVSASRDQTLKVWELASGHTLATLTGHTSVVTACAVTPDGQRVVSASEDKTLKVWDLKTYACRLTHRGDASYDAIAATATAVVTGDRAGGVWFLNMPLSVRSAVSSSSREGTHRVPTASSAHLPTGTRPAITKHTILLLAANSQGADLHALDREVRAIQVELERSAHRDRFEFVPRRVVEPLDLLRELRKLRPAVVHFNGRGGHLAPSGHHADGTPGRHVDGEHHRNREEPRDGSDSEGRLVSPQALQETFGAAGSSVRVVVLDACYSAADAEALLAHVDCVVSTHGALRDDAARSFAIGFYGGLGERESIATAYKQGCAAISLESLPDAARPQLAVRDGVDAEQLVLAADPDADGS
jgi:WD40 repeat protein